jgi:hypothetical protein
MQNMTFPVVICRKKVIFNTKERNLNSFIIFILRDEYNTIDKLNRSFYVSDKSSQPPPPQIKKPNKNKTKQTIHIHKQKTH